MKPPSLSGAAVIRKFEAADPRTWNDLNYDCPSFLCVVTAVAPCKLRCIEASRPDLVNKEFDAACDFEVSVGQLVTAAERPHPRSGDRMTASERLFGIVRQIYVVRAE